MYYPRFPRKQSLRQGLNTNAPLRGKNPAAESQRKGQWFKKEWKANIQWCVIMLPTDSQDPKDKAGDSADTCVQAFKTAPDTIPCFPMVCPREKEERMYLLDCSCSP